jgi:hypothetical protein
MGTRIGSEKLFFMTHSSDDKTIECKTYANNIISLKSADAIII